MSHPNTNTNLKKDILLVTLVAIIAYQVIQTYILPSSTIHETLPLAIMPEVKVGDAM